MATITKENAELLVKRCKNQKRPQYLVIVKYHNQIFDKTDYAYAKNETQYQAIVQSPAVCDIEILWASERFQNPEKRQKATVKYGQLQHLRNIIDSL